MAGVAALQRLHVPRARAMRSGCEVLVALWCPHVWDGGQDDAAIILDQALLPLLKLIEAGGDKEKAAAVCFLGTVVEMRPAVAVCARSFGRPLPGGLNHFVAWPPLGVPCIKVARLSVQKLLDL
jgi:hypothetical protein